MKKVFALLMMLMISLSMMACSSSPEEKLKAKMAASYTLTGEEQLKAESSAAQFFLKPFPSANGDTKKGMSQGCRPTDSNTNGKVTCAGYLPNQKTGLMDSVTMYCAYRADMALGCSTEDK